MTIHEGHVKPTYPGVYKRAMHGEQIYYAYFDGINWTVGLPYRASPQYFREQGLSVFQYLPWIDEEPELTDWYPACVKPVRPGIYQRRLSHLNSTSYACFTPQGYWTYSFSTIEALVQNLIGCTAGKSTFLSLPWRGLAEEPK